MVKSERNETADTHRKRGKRSLARTRGSRRGREKSQKEEEEEEGSEKYADEKEKSSSGAFCGNATAEEDGKTWGRRRKG